MSRRTHDLISLSFFDVLTSALGAVIFLFIIVPKATPDSSLLQTQPVVDNDNNIDTVRTLNASIAYPNSYLMRLPSMPNLLTNNQLVQNFAVQGYTSSLKFFGNSSTQWNRNKKWVGQKDENITNISTCSAQNTEGGQFVQGLFRLLKDSTNQKPQEPLMPLVVIGKEQETPKLHSSEISSNVVAIRHNTNPKLMDRNIKRPSNPCKVAFELTWDSPQDNVDLIIYKGNEFVCGKQGYRVHTAIGEWDSGRSRNRVFNNDLRTNQEAVRQFEGIVAGEYRIFALFKESVKPDSVLKVNVSGLIYTRNDKGEENSTVYTSTLSFNPKDKQMLGSVKIQPDGRFNFIKL